MLAQHFVRLGWQEAGQYTFEKKNLQAKHYEHDDPSYPKIFISALQVSACSVTVQQMVENFMASSSEQTCQARSLLIQGRLPQSPPDHDLYTSLLAESEYAAWMYLHGFRPNHFTIDVNALQGFGNLTDLNNFVLDLGYPLNTSGGVIKGGEAEGLAQSSTLAAEIPVAFSDGQTRHVPGCYYEFAERFCLPGQDRLFQGFVTGSADKIFESTDRQS